MRTLVVVISVFLSVVGVQAQKVAVRTDSTETVTMTRDTVAMDTSVLDSAALAPKVAKEPHSPKRATYMALMLPGSGQIYNRQWWKLPILYGGIGATVYGISWNAKQFKKYKNAFVDYSVYLEAKAKDPETPYPENASWDKVYIGGDAEGFTSQQQSNFKRQLQNKKDNFRRNRDLLYITIAAIYALQVIDACVFAHFYDFEIDDDLSLNIQPAAFYSPISGGSIGLTLALTF